MEEVRGEPGPLLLLEAPSALAGIERVVLSFMLTATTGTGAAINQYTL